MVISSNGKTATPDTSIELASDLSNITRYFVVMRQLNKQERKELACLLMNTVLCSCLWSDLEKGTIGNNETADSMILSSCLYIENFLKKFGREK